MFNIKSVILKILTQIPSNFLPIYITDTPCLLTLNFLNLCSYFFVHASNCTSLPTAQPFRDYFVPKLNHNAKQEIPLPKYHYVDMKIFFTINLTW